MSQPVVVPRPGNTALPEGIVYSLTAVFLFNMLMKRLAKLSVALMSSKAQDFISLFFFTFFVQGGCEKRKACGDAT